MTVRTKLLGSLVFLGSALSIGQPPPAARGRGADWKALHGPPGRWWNNPAIIQLTGIAPEQQKKLEEIYQQYRLKLIDANAALDKEEAILEAMVTADPPDDSKVLAQLDRIAQARAELEKVNARMLWSLRRVLTSDQWRKLRPEPLLPPAAKW
jgi:Spy/CpxP family protein refolding chaperone